MSNILVTGGSTGLGLALTKALLAAGHVVFNYDVKLDKYDDVTFPEGSNTLKHLVNCDLQLDVLINCAGVNEIDWLEDLEAATWDHVMDVNAKGIYKMSKFLLPKLNSSGGTILNIVSNAAHIPMNSSLAYNASKGAAHIMTRQMARELFARHGIHVFGVAPNKLKGTAMSDSIDEQVVRTRGWTKEYAQEYQLKSMPIGEETPPELVAEFIAYLLQDKDHHRFLHGCVVPYGA
jgi:NAD(P)-dependent dehydrogenase (short-subunit alcohol dehydrogenase family)